MLKPSMKGVLFPIQSNLGNILPFLKLYSSFANDRTNRSDRSPVLVFASNVFHTKPFLFVLKLFSFALPTVKKIICSWLFICFIFIETNNFGIYYDLPNNTFYLDIDHRMCSLRGYICLGHVMCYAVMFSKTLRVNRLFNSSLRQTMNPTLVSTRSQLTLIGFIVGLTLVYSTVWGFFT